MKKSIPKTGSKKGVPPDSNYRQFTCPEAPGARTSRAHFSNKTRVFEQLLKHCSKISLEKWAEFESLAIVRTTIEALFENIAGKVSCVKVSCKNNNSSLCSLFVAVQTTCCVCCFFIFVFFKSCSWSDTPWARPGEFSTKAICRRYLWLCLAPIE